ncbi:formin-J isoform X9 [Anopheles stephensi]|uniref:formin-J isoform X9 n=1 Tax=Anopheles stephensi TaxID=30069 RepID=UPI00165891B7|nr:formin-J isoform X9 [Anopheles stephensi]
MDIGMDRSGTDAGVATIGSLFQHIVNEMKNSSPLWEDFIAKATKLHACLRATIQALAAYLDAFQKIADAATNSRGATKEIGTALTRVCLRHKAVESRMKNFTTAIMDCLVVPLQEKLEDWKKQVTIIDKDHAKEYKRCRAELKKRSSDTLRLQKKAKKGAADNLHVLVESSMQDVTLRRCELEEVERKSLRAIMVEERTRYCTFVNMLQPVVHEECEVMSELGHLQEAMQLIAIVTKDPAQLPQASEELILESKANISLYPDSPGGSNSQGGCSNSLGSRKSSVCSISSINSSSSGSPGHHQFQRSLSQYSPAIRLKPGESSDSGFCSSPALTSQASTLASQSHAVSTWPPHTQDATSTVDRPHTISSAYEKGHQRPALTVYTFQSPETIAETQKSPANVACRPPLPVRCSSLERPLSTTSVKNANPNVPRQCPSPIPAHITKEHPQLQPTYVNMTELASMAASKTTNNSNTVNNNNHHHHTTASSSGGNNGVGSSNTPNNGQQQPVPSSAASSHAHVLFQQPNSPVLSSASSLISPDSNATNAISSPDVSACSTQTPQNTPQTGSPGTPNYSSIGGGAIKLGFRSTTPSSTGGGTTAVTPSESNIDTSSNHTITIDDNEEHFNTSTSASANITSATISTSDTTTITTTTTTATSATNKPSPPHCSTAAATSTLSTAGGAGGTPSKSVLDKDKDILKRTGSVLEKTSMFEQQINNNQLHQPTLPIQTQQQQQQQLSVPTSPNALYGRRTNEEIYKSAGQLLLDRDAGPTRVTRRASVNTVKPPPPVRRSSSVTPSPSVGTNSTTTTNLAQQSLAYTSSESLPPPPAYLLDSAAGSSPSISGNVAGTVKALNEIRHTPASPSVLRRAQQQQQSNPPSNQGSPTQYGTNLYGTLPSKHGHDHSTVTASSPAAAPVQQTHYPPSQHHHPSTPPNSFHATDSNKPLSNRSPKTNLHQQGGIYAQPKQLSTMSSFRTSSPGPQKPNSSFLAQLNAKIAPNKSSQSPSPVPYQQQQANNYGYTTAPPSGSELIYQRSTPVDPRAYNNNQQQQLQQQQQQQQYYHQSQQQHQQQPPPHPPREGKHSIYSAANQTSSQQHYQQHQQQQYYHNQYPTQQTHQQLQYQQQQSSPYYYQQQQQQQQAPQKQPQYGHVLPPAGAASSSSSNSALAGGSYATQNIYVSTNPFVSSVQTSAGGGGGSGVASVGSYSPSSFGKGARHHDDVAASGGASGSSTPNRTNHHSRNSSANNNGAAAGGGSAPGGSATHNVLAKTSAGFLENLNARLAEQRLSGKAFAVRNLINSKALPDPRVCHESLMDQIKRGATLKRNRTINDRSAPKIH